jgi:Family of unknown function (DUF6492)
MSSIGLVTPTYWRDLERCALLCESVDRYVTGFAKHYLIVADEEVPLFAGFNSERRVVLPTSSFLPPWLKPLPRFIQRRNRRYWWSRRAKPVSGWHVQQFIKIGAASVLPEARYCMLDSDVVFFRPLDLSPVARSDRMPLFHMARAVAADMPMHGPWVRSAHRLLGLEPPSFPATDFIGHIIFWDQRAVRAMTARIEKATGLEWVDALCRARDISEYMLYGYFVRNDPGFSAKHLLTARQSCLSYWDADALDRPALERMLRSAGESYVALSAASFSRTPVDLIRSALSAFAAPEQKVA